jgi:Cys-tRNA(Pro)/Cys-tRNA(Cys) deacylase
LSTDQTVVTRDLTEKGIPHRLFRHPGKVESLEQAAQERGQRPDQIIRSILFRLGEGEYALVLAAGKRRISWTALRRYFGQSRLTMAAEDEVLAVTGHPLGAVSPFGTKQPVRVLIDRSVLQEQEISLGSGERYATVFMQVHDLLGALPQAEIGSFVEDPL